MLKTQILAAALYAASALNSQAATTLRGLELFSCGPTGRAQTTGSVGGTVWTAQPGGGPAKAWVTSEFAANGGAGRNRDPRLGADSIKNRLRPKWENSRPGAA